MMKNIILLILLFSISVNSQKVQQVEVVKNDNQISELFEELGQNEFKLDLEKIKFVLKVPQPNSPFKTVGDFGFIGISNMIHSECLGGSSMLVSEEDGVHY